MWFSFQSPAHGYRISFNLCAAWDAIISSATNSLFRYLSCLSSTITGYHLSDKQFEKHLPSSKSLVRHGYWDAWSCTSFLVIKLCRNQLKLNWALYLAQAIVVRTWFKALLNLRAGYENDLMKNNRCRSHGSFVPNSISYKLRRAAEVKDYRLRIVDNQRPSSKWVLLEEEEFLGCLRDWYLLS